MNRGKRKGLRMEGERDNSRVIGKEGERRAVEEFRANMGRERR